MAASLQAPRSHIRWLPCQPHVCHDWKTRGGGGRGRMRYHENPWDTLLVCELVTTNIWSGAEIFILAVELCERLAFYTFTGTQDRVDCGQVSHWSFFFYAKSFLLFSFAGLQVFQLSSVPISNDHHISLRNEHYIMCFFLWSYFLNENQSTAGCFFSQKHQGIFIRSSSWRRQDIRWRRWVGTATSHGAVRLFSMRTRMGYPQNSMVWINHHLLQFLYIRTIIKLCRKKWINFGSMNYPLQVLGTSTCGSNHWRHIHKTWDPHQSQHETWFPSTIFIHTDMYIQSLYI